MKHITLALLLAGLALAQQPVQDGRYNPNLPRYKFRVTSSSGVTIQSSSTSGQAFLETIDAQCSADAVLTFRQFGTAATTTASTPILISPSAGAPPPSVFTNTNVGAGTTLATFNIAAATATSPPNVYDISPYSVTGGGPTTVNFSLTVSTGSCTFQGTFRMKYQ